MVIASTATSHVADFESRSMGVCACVCVRVFTLSNLRHATQVPRFPT